MTSPLPELPVAEWNARAIADNADRLGLIWKLRPASVIFPATDDPTGTTVIMDGDTVAINAYSLVGLLRPGERVMCAIVPPSGLYIVGYAGGTPAPAVLAGAVADFEGSIYTIGSGTETDITELRLENVMVDPDHQYSFQGTMFLANGGSSGDSWLFRWRETTPLTGTVVSSFLHLTVVSGFTDDHPYDSAYRPTATGPVNLYLSAQRIAGGGTLIIDGNGNTHSRIVRLGNYTGPAPVFEARF